MGLEAATQMVRSGVAYEVKPHGRLKHFEIDSSGCR